MASRGVLALSKFLGPCAEALGPMQASLQYSTAGGVAKYKLPDLPYAYSALEPIVSGTIMELHHAKHHAAYVANLNKALEEYADAESKQDLQKMIALQSAINFNGGGAHAAHTLSCNIPRQARPSCKQQCCLLPIDLPTSWRCFLGSAGHINHDIFWTNLAPIKVGGEGRHRLLV